MHSDVGKINDCDKEMIGGFDDKRQRQEKENERLPLDRRRSRFMAGDSVVDTSQDGRLHVNEWSMLAEFGAIESGKSEPRRFRFDQSQLRGVRATHGVSQVKKVRNNSCPFANGKTPA